MFIADISGYTTYLAGTEIDHAQNVLEDLLETVVSRLVPVFTIIKGEGDAVFLFAPGGSVGADILLDVIDACYFSFRRRLRDITQATTCDCNACLLIPRLDLKFVVHGGQAVRQTQFGALDLVGTDVIVIHRLLKNHITEEHGWRAYALLTDAAVKQVGLDCLRLGMVAHHEAYDDAGSVVGFAEDLEARWQEEMDRVTSHLTPEEALTRYDAEFPVPQHVAWEWVTSPRLRPQWMRGVDRVDQDAADGRAGVGTTNHCVHGKEAVMEQVLDWRPFDTTTVQTGTPAGPLLTTYVFEPNGSGTHVMVLVGSRDPGAPGFWPMVTPLIDDKVGGAIHDLAAILAAQAAEPVAAEG